jgi:hypothetical protein
VVNNIHQSTYRRHLNRCHQCKCRQHPSSSTTNNTGCHQHRFNHTHTTNTVANDSPCGPFAAMAARLMILLVMEILQTFEKVKKKRTKKRTATPVKKSKKVR